MYDFLKKYKTTIQMNVVFIQIFLPKKNKLAVGSTHRSPTTTFFPSKYLHLFSPAKKNKNKNKDQNDVVLTLGRQKKIGRAARAPRPKHGPPVPSYSVRGLESPAASLSPLSHLTGSAVHVL